MNEWHWLCKTEVLAQTLSLCHSNTIPTWTALIANSVLRCEKRELRQTLFTRRSNLQHHSFEVLADCGLVRVDQARCTLQAQSRSVKSLSNIRHRDWIQALPDLRSNYNPEIPLRVYIRESSWCSNSNTVEHDGPPRRPCYRPTVFLIQLHLTALSFPQGKIWRAFQKLYFNVINFSKLRTLTLLKSENFSRKFRSKVHGQCTARWWTGTILYLTV
jgi:hypothetical protein